MMKHTRTYCAECKRQRLIPVKYFVNSAPLTITGNKRDDLCVYCGSGSIEEVVYTPKFLGGDYIPPGVEEVIPKEVSDTGEDYDPKKVKETAPGMAMNNTINMLITGDDPANETLQTVWRK